MQAAKTAKTAKSCITTQHFLLQAEYTRTRRIRVTICNVPANLPGNVVASFLSAYGKMEYVAQLRVTAGTAHEDNMFQLCLNKEGFQAIPDTINYQDKQTMVAVEGKQPHRWNCKQLGHLTKVCPQKASMETAC